jgi:hypothetical protein
MRAIFACVSAFVACAQDAVMAVDLYVLRLRANDGCYAQLEVLDSLDWAGLFIHCAAAFILLIGFMFPFMPHWVGAFVDFNEGPS